MRMLRGRSRRDHFDPERSGAVRVAVEKLTPGRAVLYGAAHMLDFRGALVQRRGFLSAEEAMATAWREVTSALPQIPDDSHGVPVGGSGYPSRSEPTAYTPPIDDSDYLFDHPGSSNDELTPGEVVGYRGPTACAAAGITYRQLDYWARTGLVEPSARAEHGSGSQRLYSFRDILVLKVVKRLLDTGISLQQVREAIQYLRDRGTDDLAQVTLMSDGNSVYECTSADEVVDLLQGGQGVFGIALGRIWREVEGDLAELPAVRSRDTATKKHSSPTRRESTG
jgi:DNA-binding transcriptional MerR regulator